MLEEEKSVNIINAHPFLTDDENLTEKNFSIFTAEKLISILEKRNTILENMTGTQYRKTKTDTTITVSAYENGVKIECDITENEGLNEPGEEAVYYLFDNGEIEYVPKALYSFNLGHKDRNDDLLEQLDSKLGEKYIEKPNPKGLAGLFKSNKKENKEIIKHAKEVISARLDAAANKLNQRIEPISDEDVKKQFTEEDRTTDEKDALGAIGAVNINDPIIEKISKKEEPEIKPVEIAEVNDIETLSAINKEVAEESEEYQQVYDSTFNHFAEKEVFENTIPYDPSWEKAEEPEIRNAHDWAKIDAGQKDNNDSAKIKSNENGFAKPWLLGVLTGAVSVGMIMTTALLIMK